MKRMPTRRAPMYALTTQQLSEVLGGDGSPLPAARRDGTPLPAVPDGTPLPA